MPIVLSATGFTVTSWSGTRYLRRRISALVPVALGVATLTFALIHLVPGDPVVAMLGDNAQPSDIVALRHELGLDRPLWRQYVSFIGGVAHADLGESISMHEPVARLIARVTPEVFLRPELPPIDEDGDHHEVRTERSHALRLNECRPRSAGDSSYLLAEMEFCALPLKVAYEEIAQLPARQPAPRPIHLLEDRDVASALHAARGNLHVKIARADKDRTPAGFGFFMNRNCLLDRS